MQNTREHRDAVRRAMKPIDEFFAEKGVAYAVVGSIAGISHGYGRPTADVDMVAELPAPDGLAAEFEKRFIEKYYVDAAMIRDAFKWRASFNLYHFETGMKIDIFVSKGSDFDREVTRRRELEHMDDDVAPAFWVESAEDLILSKLVWFRKGNEVSDQKWKDVLAILKVQSLSIDLDYLQLWAPQLGVADLLDRALDEAGFNEMQTQSD